MLPSFEEIIANELIGENDWIQISDDSNMNLEFIREYKNLLNWSSVTLLHEKLLKDNFDEFEKYLDWDMIGRAWTLDENLLNKCINKQLWNALGHNLGIINFANFLNEYSDKLWWPTLIQMDIPFWILEKNIHRPVLQKSWITWEWIEEILNGRYTKEEIQLLKQKYEIMIQLTRTR